MTLQYSNKSNTMKTILSVMLLAICLPCSAEPPGPEAPAAKLVVDRSVDDTINRIRLEQIKAVEAYLAANPKAADRDEVLEFLIARYGELARHYEGLVVRNQKPDDKQREFDALERQYSFMVKRADTDLETVSKNIVSRFYFVWKGPRATPEEQKKAQGIFDQGKIDYPKLKDDWWFCHQESKLKWPRVGESMPIEFTALDGSKVDSTALKGKVVLVHFWESSELRSVECLPALKAAYQKFHGEGFEVIGIPFDSDKAALREFIKKENMPWPQAFDGKGWKTDMAVKYGIVTVPLSFILGRDGKVADFEFLDGSELEAKVAKQFK